MDPSIKRSRAALRATGLALLVLTLTAVAQAAVYSASGSVALLADLIHNAGDAATALPLAVAFAARSVRAERLAGLAVVVLIFISACAVGYQSVERLVHPHPVDGLLALALAGLLGFGGNSAAARIRTRAGGRLNSPALVADGNHAHADALISLSVIASAAALAVGLKAVDALIGLGVTGLILQIAWRSWQGLRAAPPSPRDVT